MESNFNIAGGMAPLALVLWGLFVTIFWMGCAWRGPWMSRPSVDGINSESNESNNWTCSMTTISVEP